MVLSGAVGLAWGCARELSAILFAPVREAASTGRTKHEASTREARNLSRRSEAHLAKTHWGARMASVRSAGGRPLLRDGRARTLQPYLSNSPRAPVRDACSPAKRRRPVVPSQMPRRRRRVRRLQIRVLK